MEIPSGQSAKWLSIPIIATISRLLCQELTVQNEYLRLENKILKSKIKGRIQFTDDERRSLVDTAFAMSTKLIESVVNIVKPDTIIAWQRRLDKKKWDYSDSRDLRIHNPCLQPCRNLCFSCPTPHIRLRRFTQPLPCLSRLPSGPIFLSCKVPEFFEMSPLSGTGKHPDFQVTVCLQNVSTDVKFDD